MEPVFREQKMEPVFQRNVEPKIEENLNRESEMAQEKGR